MKLSKLISELQKLLEAESSPELLELFGEPEIMIDTFVYDEAKKAFDYRGIDHDVVIERSPDGVYLILSKIREYKMENQHRKIKGYRELNQTEIDLMNEVKTLGVSLGNLVDKLRNNTNLDQRWVNIGAIDLQKGLMALTRSVAQPDFF